MKHSNNKIFLIISLIFFTAFSLYARKERVLVHMLPEQFEYFRDSIVAKFELKEDVKIEIINAPELDKIPWIIKMNPGKFMLAKIPFTYTSMLVDSGYIRPLDSFLPSDDIEKFKKDYMLTFFGRKNLKQYLLPRKFETRIMAVRKEPIEELRKQLNYYKDSISIVLKEMNGHGLPRNFVLENDPDLWNDYDIFVLAWIWSRLEYDDGINPRVAFRSKNYSGTSLRIIDRVRELGGDSLSIMTMNTPEVVDAFFWEAALAYAGVLNKDMFTNEWDGKRIWRGFRDDGLFLSFVTQVDAFMIIGENRDSLERFIDNPSDLEFHLMPSGASLSIDSRGIRERIGTHSVNTGGWWWAIPQSSSSFELGYKLYQFITQKNIVLKESLKFGMIPIRNDVVNSKKILLNSGKRSEILRMSYLQLQKNGNNLLPAHKSFGELSNLYLEAWNYIVKGKHWAIEKGGTPNFNYISSLLKRKYAGKAAKLIGRKLDDSTFLTNYEDSLKATISSPKVSNSTLENSEIKNSDKNSTDRKKNDAIDKKKRSGLIKDSVGVQW